SKRDWSSDVCSSDLLCRCDGMVALVLCPYLLPDRVSEPASGDVRMDLVLLHLKARRPTDLLEGAEGSVIATREAHGCVASSPIRSEEHTSELQSRFD